MQVEWNTGVPPKEKKSYLVTCSGEKLKIVQWTNINQISNKETNRWRWEDLTVKAWSELPDPYKENAID